MPSMQQFLHIVRSINGKFIIAGVLLFTAALLYGLAGNTQSTVHGHEDEHLDRPIDASIVELHGDHTFEKSALSELEGRIMNNIYSRHYEETRQIEREAVLVHSVRSTGEGSYVVAVRFLPSGTGYTANITIDNPTEKDFSIDITPEDS